MEIDYTTPLGAADGPTTAYMLLRYLGYELDELSSQGMRVWPDERGRWHWRWEGRNLNSQQSFWALGEAIVDAVATRYPSVFVSPAESQEPRTKN